MSALRIAFAGTPDFSVPALEALLGSRHSVVGVLTQPDRPKGRGRQLAASPVKVAALEHGLRVSQPETLKTEAGRADLVGWNPDLLVVVAYGLILPPSVLTLPRLGCLNIHASLLPRWRGAAPIQRAILAGDALTGITIMLMDAGLDTGPMLLKKELPISPTDTGGSLHDRLASLGADALLEALEGHAQGTLKRIPQPTQGATYAAKLEKSEALIDWNRDALEIERQVRAFNPWPIAETRLDGEQLRIFEATAEPSDSSAADAASTAGAKAGGAPRRPTAAPAAAPGRTAEVAATAGASATDSHEIGAGEARHPAHNKDAPQPGTIIAIRDNSLLIQCGRGHLAVRQLQRPGRRAISAGEFARSGGAALIGKRLG